MKIVCDTNVLISALLWGGTPGRILERIEKAQIVETSNTPMRVVPDDPDDDHVNECASTAHADYIVTGDSHLLDLNVWKSIPILSAREYLQKV